MLERSEALRQIGRGDQQSGTGIPGDVLDFADMEPGIRWNRAETRRPAGEHQFQKLGAVLHAQHDAIAGFQPASGEAAREARDAAGKFAIPPGVETVADGRGGGLPSGDIEQQRCEVHGEAVPRRPRDP
jgi:hypothetical protein